MSDDATAPSKRVLDPMERVSEVLFGLIMVLGFTGSLSVATADRTQVRSMLLAALGCNLAWGIIDGVFYLMSCLSERGQKLRLVRTVRATADPLEAHRMIADALPPILASALPASSLELMRLRVVQLAEPVDRARLKAEDWRGALGVFLLVFLATFPVAVPFLIFREPRVALRVSNGVAIVMLFVCGQTLGRYAGKRPWTIGLAIVIAGLAMVAITIALGG
jgi:VIT1/CCC1 family predicted Fe2+/Mn2+ transporter